MRKRTSVKSKLYSLRVRSRQARRGAGLKVLTSHTLAVFMYLYMLILIYFVLYNFILLYKKYTKYTKYTKYIKYKKKKNVYKMYKL